LVYFSVLFNTPILSSQQSSSCEVEGSSPRPRRRWSRRMGSMDLKVKSMLDLRQLESFSFPLFPSKTHDVHKDHPPPRNQELGSTISLQTIAAWVRYRILQRLAIVLYENKLNIRIHLYLCI